MSDAPYSDGENVLRGLPRLHGLGNLQLRVYQLLCAGAPRSFAELLHALGVRRQMRRRGSRWLEVDVPTTNSGSLARALRTLIDRGLVIAVAREGVRGHAYCAVLPPASHADSRWAQ